MICAVTALRFCYGYVRIIHTYKQGNYKTVEGYVENFVPASKGGETNEDTEQESFDIKGVHFSYGDRFIKKFGYHLPSTQGGYIKKDGQYLRLGYIWVISRSGGAYEKSSSRRMPLSGYHA